MFINATIRINILNLFFRRRADRRCMAADECIYTLVVLSYQVVFFLAISGELRSNYLFDSCENCICDEGGVTRVG